MREDMNSRISFDVCCLFIHTCQFIDLHRRIQIQSHFPKGTKEEEEEISLQQIIGHETKKCASSSCMRGCASWKELKKI